MSDEHPDRAPSLPRLMVLRGAFVGFALAIVFGGWFHFDPRAMAAAALAGIFGGGIVAIMTVIELNARSRPPSRGRDLGATLLALVVALVACGAAIVQVPYTVKALGTHSLGGSLDAFTASALPVLEQHYVSCVGLALVFAPVFAATALSGLGRGKARAYLELMPLSGFGFFLLGSATRGLPIDTFRVFVLYVASLILLPLLLELSDRLEERIAQDEES